MLFTLFFEYLFYSSKEFRSLIHIDFHRLFYDACCSIFNELSALLHRFSAPLSATACILYHLLSLLSTPFFKFFQVFFSLVASLVSIVLCACFCASCTTRLLPTRVLRDFNRVISRTGSPKPRVIGVRPPTDMMCGYHRTTPHLVQVSLQRNLTKKSPKGGSPLMVHLPPR